MVAQISQKLELFFLDLFIFVLSETKWFRKAFQIAYALCTDKPFLTRFVATIILASLVGLGVGFVLSMLTEVLI